jgi:hypothetical protein
MICLFETWMPRKRPLFLCDGVQTNRNLLCTLGEIGCHRRFASIKPPRNISDDELIDMPSGGPTVREP